MNTPDISLDILYNRRKPAIFVPPILKWSFWCTANIAAFLPCSYMDPGIDVLMLKRLSVL